MTLVKWNSNGNANPAFSNLLENFFGKDLGEFVGRDYATTTPAVNVVETKENFTVEVAAPGLKKENFQINLNNNLLTIASTYEKSNEEANGKYTRKEFGYTSFQRSFTLPTTVDSSKIEASYKEGILYVYLPKREEAKEKPARQINIS
ncbi:Hsp20/alpha crystallin family protein [Rhodocytophaga rosea]|uniref:Hsp20/alpha crystallin family protein n=1 Tax=Rhodocytophaga rosea TaxID=2704465 RepID=A0A6C0GNC1_9BACT|nr:Hsp20/alpha crystallin family protein [Rhodocytophaga rosea]QHT69529.1 Hsp20/alpha crystallin family protein [Rhodocytophaga rosea]